MSSLRRDQPSKANRALRASENAIVLDLCAGCVVLEDEERENFLNLLQQHIHHFRPVDEVEFGLVEEMCAALPPAGDVLDRTLHTSIMLRIVKSPNEPSPISGHSCGIGLPASRLYVRLYPRRRLATTNYPFPVPPHSKNVPSQPTVHPPSTDSPTLMPTAPTVHSILP
jgi:hypothetical protein